MSSLPEMPCGPILELNGQRKRFQVPFGLKPLMDEMIRGVLEHQPENIYEYLACFMEERIMKKDEVEINKSKKSWQVHRWSWEASSLLSEDDLYEFLQIYRASHDEADHYATVIQTAFRGHLAREKVKGMRNSMIVAVPDDINKDNHHHATVIQAAFRGYLARKEELESNGSEESEEHDYADEMETSEEDDDEQEGEDMSYEDSEEELETEVEISEMEDLAEEMDMLTMKSRTSVPKFKLGETESLSVSKTGLDQSNEEEETAEEEEHAL